MKPFIHLPSQVLAFLAVVMACNQAIESLAAEPQAEIVWVMSLNLWHGGDGGKQPLDQMVTLIRQSQADLVGLQETAGFAPQGKPRPDRTAEIARRLGWHHVEQGGGTGIVSRFEIVAVTPKKWGIKVKLPSGRHLYHFNAHLFHSPYQPYQLLGIPYGKAPFLKTGEEAVQAARDTRGDEVARLLAEVKTILPDGVPVFITGDFNEPSHLDWTPASVKAGHCPLPVLWPSTQAVEAAGFIDTYRAVYPDPVKNRGLTWTPRTRVDDPKDRHDRIDFVFVGGPPFRVRAARVVGESPEYADVVVSPYPSDHRAVVSEVEFPAGK
ncbi:endonuclease/exonuclease/phosphatase family protein [Brevifollis gellanilyticus]|uniref:Endonuclease n=1 Tax=Brevifollis gellanilyticus TaxID=748831 RepID=A0A512MDW8_9BACT|nr:endonuclease/exonuclease/phosphatase family protein [Brevifollis gellanilyticus]GEP44924.1 endonuclease [Brevifollis gellanilyticus]